MSDEPNGQLKPQATPAPADHDTARQNPQKSSRDRWVKIGFLVAIVLVGVFVYSQQQDALEIKGWGTDLDAALQQAHQEQRPIVAFFVNVPPSKTAEATKNVVLSNPQNQEVMAELRLVRVLVNDPSDELRQTYNIQKLPTLLLFDANGKELSRHDGPSHVGEVPFRETFLVPLRTSE
jgi:hypothetical protein